MSKKKKIVAVMPVIDFEKVYNLCLCISDCSICPLLGVCNGDVLGQSEEVTDNA